MGVMPPLTCRADVLHMLDELAVARRSILERCGRLTPEQLNDPVLPGTWPVLKILAHLAWAEEWMLSWIRVRPGELTTRPPEVPPELDAIRTALDEAHAGALAFLKAHPESVLAEPCRYGKWGEQTVGGIFFHLVRHEIHHRAFVLHKLERLGV